MNETIIAKRTLAKSLPNRDYIRAVAELVHLDGNARPYFSVHRELWYATKAWTGRQHQQRKPRDPDACGCMHDDVLAAFPELAPVVRVHLADDNGVPMHALANGWYFYSGKAHENDPYNRFRGRTPHEVAATALNIEPDQLPQGLDYDQFAEFVESLRPVWRKQAEAAKKVLSQGKHA
jgi:hypothetical protein